MITFTLFKLKFFPAHKDDNQSNDTQYYGQLKSITKRQIEKEKERKNTRTLSFDNIEYCMMYTLYIYTLLL